MAAKPETPRPGRRAIGATVRVMAGERTTDSRGGDNRQSGPAGRPSPPRGKPGVPPGGPGRGTPGSPDVPQGRRWERPPARGGEWYPPRERGTPPPGPRPYDPGPRRSGPPAPRRPGGPGPGQGFDPAFRGPGRDRAGGPPPGPRSARPPGDGWRRSPGPRPGIGPKPGTRPVPAWPRPDRPYDRRAPERAPAGAQESAEAPGVPEELSWSALPLAADLVRPGEELIAGRRPVDEVLAARRVARRLLVVPHRRASLEALVSRATREHIDVVEVEGGTLTSLAGFHGHQGVALVVERRRRVGFARRHPRPSSHAPEGAAVRPGAGFARGPAQSRSAAAVVRRPAGIPRRRFPDWGPRGAADPGGREDLGRRGRASPPGPRRRPRGGAGRAAHARGLRVVGADERACHLPTRRRTCAAPWRSSSGARGAGIGRGGPPAPATSPGAHPDAGPASAP